MLLATRGEGNQGDGAVTSHHQQREDEEKAKKLGTAAVDKMGSPCLAKKRHHVKVVFVGVSTLHGQDRSLYRQIVKSIISA